MVDLGILYYEKEYCNDPVNFLRRYETVKIILILKEKENCKTDAELEPITERYRDLIKGYDDKMKNSYKVQRVFIPE